jgi:hypothetical protein
MIGYTSWALVLGGIVTTAMDGPWWVAIPLMIIPCFYLLYEDFSTVTNPEKNSINNHKSLNEIRKLISYVWNDNGKKEYFNFALAPKFGYFRFNSIHSPEVLFKGKFTYELIRKKTDTDIAKLSVKEKKLLCSNLYQMKAKDYFEWDESKETNVLKKDMLHLISLFENKNYQISLKPILLKYEITFPVLLNTLEETLKIEKEIPESMSKKIINIFETFLAECNIEISKIDKIEQLKKNGELKSLEERIDFEQKFIDKIKVIKES